ncbi:survival of motor neuron-related-splicing factor 30 [Lingula anatina]|uniref:Survival of motor neuron-related-splicing factor 30 n=1 Tax=Lingula anatina TaxID=7574 RepID=A0A1S3JS66_LINAN|nr:survival of motor neuron-related-splicing factor 30 [Lingula anatina]|eukprot:XP_013412951.1 survival of motor neuron-related-splicing factor 30 [Lingula anatina]
MAEDLQESLTNYKLQLQQVEAALTTDPSNADLNKLKIDLQEVINLTVDLIKNQAGAVATAVVAAATSADDNETSTATHSWNVGDKCSAIYSEDGMYYDAVIDEVLEDGSCTVTFESYGNTDLTQVSLLKPRDSSLKRAAGEEAEGSGGKMKRKDKLAAEREYKKKKNEKKRQRQKQQEEEREDEKKKWQSFNAKNKRVGFNKKSIFATPEAPTGKVGVGTCGIGGRPMTNYHQNEKWKKGL